MIRYLSSDRHHVTALADQNSLVLLVQTLFLHSSHGFLPPVPTDINAAGALRYGCSGAI